MKQQELEKLLTDIYSLCKYTGFVSKDTIVEAIKKRLEASGLLPKKEKYYFDACFIECDEIVIKYVTHSDPRSVHFEKLPKGVTEFSIKTSFEK